MVTTEDAQRAGHSPGRVRSVAWAWWRVVVVAGIGLVAGTAAQAQVGVKSDGGVRSPLRVVLGLGMTHGGEKLSTVYFDNGESENAKLGSGVDWRLGGEWQLDSLVGVQATLGYRDDRIEGGNGYVGFRRTNWEALGQFYLSPQWQVAAGVGRSFDSVYRDKRRTVSSIQNSTQDFDAHLAKIVQIEFLPEPQYGFAARYVWERYTPQGYTVRLEGNHLGLYFFVHLP